MFWLKFSNSALVTLLMMDSLWDELGDIWSFFCASFLGDRGFCLSGDLFCRSGNCSFDSGSKDISTRLRCLTLVLFGIWDPSSRLCVSSMIDAHAFACRLRVEWVDLAWDSSRGSIFGSGVVMIRSFLLMGDSSME